MLERLHEVLYRADLGATTTDRLVNNLRQSFKGNDESVTWDAASQVLRSDIESILVAHERPLKLAENGPTVYLIVGVNGVGKTTSIGKLAHHFISQGKTVLLAAGDTFRAAAIDQLVVWGDRIGVEVVKHQPGSDPAAVAYDAVKAAVARKIDVVLIDTAGRLHNKQELMDELAKIRRVIGRDVPEAPHETLLVIDATTGQNAVMQVKAFSEVANVTGLIVTKLDGTAKGGVIIGVSDKYHLPIQFVGVGEQAEDLRPFSAREFSSSVL